MHIFISAYVLLALASWSALAAPLSGYERDYKSAQKRSLSSSILMGRQSTIFGPGTGGPPKSTSDNPNPGLSLGPATGVIGPQVEPDTEPTASQTQSHGSTMDCDTKSKSHKDDGKTNDDQPSTTTTDPNSNPNPTTTLTATSPGPEPAIARRRFGNPIRRDSKTSPSIFERDDAPTKGASSNPITIGDVITEYLNQRAAARKRAPSPPRTSRNFH